MIELNYHTWHMQRQLKYCPKHFVGCNTKLTDDAMYWILERCTGRFYIKNAYEQDFLFLEADNYPFFEDPKEAVLFELTWG